jgi:hypothetical protein
MAAAAIAASGAGASVAAATPGPTSDQGLTGACNMTNTQAFFGMFTKAPQSGPGVDGVINAINITNGTTEPPCPSGP